MPFILLENPYIYIYIHTYIHTYIRPQTSSDPPSDPPMVKTAEEEYHKAKVGLMGAMAAEGYHANLYKMALDAVKTGKDMAPMEIWYCPVCGHIEYGANPPAKCPICGLPAAKYIKM